MVKDPWFLTLLTYNMRHLLQAFHDLTKMRNKVLHFLLQISKLVVSNQSRQIWIGLEPLQRDKVPLMGDKRDPAKKHFIRKVPKCMSTASKVVVSFPLPL
jgi:hypothetical protein